MAGIFQGKHQKIEITGGCQDVLIISPGLSEVYTSGRERFKSELNKGDIEILKKDKIPEEYWNDEIKIVEARLMMNFHTLRSCSYHHDRDESNVYSIVNIKAEKDMTVGTATDAIINLKNSKKEKGRPWE